MLNKTIYIIMLLVLSVGCRKSNEEDPFDVARSYCNCIEKQENNSRDSLIDIYDCENQILPNSRLMRIYLDFDGYNNFSQLTIDSAKNFALEVRNIIDTICFDKIKPERIK